MSFPVLGTERMQLVEITKEHAGNLYDILSKDEVTRMYGMDSLMGIEEAIQLIDSMEKSYSSSRGIRWGMIDKAANRLIGTAGLNQLNKGSRRAEIGYELHPSYWGKGYASEAVKEILDYSFSTLGLFRIGAVTYPDNKASILLLKKFGFKKEGMLRGYLHQHGLSHDAFVFSLLQPEWKKIGDQLRK